VPINQQAAELQVSHHPLDALFRPGTLALIGATDRPGSVGAAVLRNLTCGKFRDRVYLVNPHRERIGETLVFASVGDIPETVDLAVIVTPAATVPAVVRDCVAAGVRSAVIISAGFRERGPEGAELEQQIQQAMAGSSMRILGPNCLGLMNPLSGLNATFARPEALPGNLAFLSQSGALCTAILDWSLREIVGFSAFVSTGSMLDIGWGDLIYYFGDDPNTRSILIYMESVGDARGFLSAAREVALSKPIVVIKPGRSAAGAKAAISHTGAMTGADEVLDAAFRRTGVLRVQTVAELFDMAEVLGKQRRPRGPRLMILTNAGGPAVLATDALVAGNGVVSELSPASRSELDGSLPSHWSHANPVDILGDASPERYSKALRILGADDNADALLVIMAPQEMTDPTAVAEKLITFAGGYAKPLLASWMGGGAVEPAIASLNRAGIPTFSFPDAAAQAFNYMWQYSRNLSSLYETPVATEPPEIRSAVQLKVASWIDEVRSKGRNLLTEIESKQIIEAYGISVVPTRYASTADQAVHIAQEIGFPVVVKLHSETVTHKARIGGVRLNLHDRLSVRQAFQQIADAVERSVGAGHFQGVTVQPMMQADGLELILGSSLDAQFGPVLLFGAGGKLAEILRDRALALPPLTATLALRMMERTKIFAALKERFGETGAMHAAEALVRLSWLVVEQPWIREIDINPLLLDAARVLALDGRIVLHPPETRQQDLPRTAIRPYPSQYIEQAVLKDGTSVLIRPIRPEDEPLVVEFHKQLSEATLYQRYFQAPSLRYRTSHERLRRVCFIDYDREIALVALRAEKQGGEILGIGRIIKLHGKNEAEVAVVIADRYQGLGLGTHLSRLLLRVAREEGIEGLHAWMLPQNAAMQAIVRRLGFHITADPESSFASATLALTK
jgi:acetyltransferase